MSASGTTPSISRPNSCRGIGELGLLGIQVPDAYGGASMSAVDYCICIEELAASTLASHFRRGAQRLVHGAHLRFGSAAQKDAYLRSLARGDKIGAWGLTESTSGSDAASMRTTAVRGRRVLGSQWLEDLLPPRGSCRPVRWWSMAYPPFSSLPFPN
jgi:alkylation response protein AidB-like acyl-CoA dehydrogenase